MAKRDLLDLDTRRRIVEVVGENPGLHLRGIADLLSMPVSTVEYHCYQLHKHGHVVTRENGGFKAFYPAEGMDRRDKDVLYLMRQEVPRRICTFLLTNPNCTPKDLKAFVGLSAPTLSFHLKKMRLANLTIETPHGRTKLLDLADPERVANVLVTYQRSFVDDVVDRFVATWSELRPPTKESAAAKSGGSGKAQFVAETSDAKYAAEGVQAGNTQAPGGDKLASHWVRVMRGSHDGTIEAKPRHAWAVVRILDALALAWRRWLPGQSRIPE